MTIVSSHIPSLGYKGLSVWEFESLGL